MTRSRGPSSSHTQAKPVASDPNVVSPTGRPAADPLVRRRRLEWLSTSLLRLRGRPRSLADAEEFTSLFRQSATELARTRAFAPGQNRCDHLAAVVAQGHLAASRSQRPGFRSVLVAFALEVPTLIRRYWRYHMVALLLTLVCTGIAWAVVREAPETFSLFVDDQLSAGRDPYASRETLARSLKGEGLSLEAGGIFSAFLFVHNTQVAFLCLCLGMLLGLPTIYLLMTNGLMLGAFIAVFTGADLGVEFLAWLLPHAVPEIGAIVLCGGAGLAVGHRMLNPGELSRIAMLRRTAADAAVTAMGCVPLLFLAGLIEGIFRQSAATTSMRYALFGFLLAAFSTWILLASRRSTAEPA